MDRNGVKALQFQGFMVDSAQANWHAMRIIYGSKNPKVPMEGRERTCYLHWMQPLEKPYIVHELQDQHRVLSKQYKDAHTMVEVETRYWAI